MRTLRRLSLAVLFLIIQQTSSSGAAARNIQDAEAVAVQRLTEILDRGIKRDVQFPYFHDRPETPEERQETLDAVYLREFQKKEIESGRIQEGGQAMHLFRAIMSWEDASKRARTFLTEDAVHQATLHSFQDIRTRGLARGRMGLEKYPRENAPGEEGTDFIFLNIVGEPRYEDCKPIYREIMSWKSAPAKAKSAGGRFAPYQTASRPKQLSVQTNAGGPIRGRSNGGMPRAGTQGSTAASIQLSSGKSWDGFDLSHLAKDQQHNVLNDAGSSSKDAASEFGAPLIPDTSQTPMMPLDASPFDRAPSDASPFGRAPSDLWSLDMPNSAHYLPLPEVDPLQTPTTHDFQGIEDSDIDNFFAQSPTANEQHVSQSLKKSFHTSFLFLFVLLITCAYTSFTFFLQPRSNSQFQFYTEL